MQSKNNVNCLIRDAKSSHLRKKIECADSSRELFKIANELLGGNGRPILPGSIPSAELPEAFNLFFMDRIEKIRAELNHQATQKHNDDPVFQGSNLNEFHSVSEASVKELPVRCIKRPVNLILSQPPSSMILSMN